MTEYSTRSDRHIVQSFDSDLQEIASKVAAMGGLVEKQITDAMRALFDRDTELAEHVVAADPTIDAMQREIEQKAILTLARRQPMAVDLREIVAATPAMTCRPRLRSGGATKRSMCCAHRCSTSS
jgi:phosphate transport system protein